MITKVKDDFIHGSEKEGYVIVNTTLAVYVDKKSIFTSFAEWGTTTALADAHFFTNKKEAVKFAKRLGLKEEEWCVAPAKLIDFVDLEKASPVK